MHLDIRIPIGLLFIVVGVLLAVFGVLTMFNIGADKAIYAQLVGLQHQFIVGPGDVSVWRLHVHYGPPRHLGRSHRRGKSGRAAVG